MRGTVTTGEEGQLHVGWIDVGTGDDPPQWARAFETREPENAFWRLFQAGLAAGSRQSRLLPAGIHPADAPPPIPPVSARSVWVADPAGGPPAVTTFRAIGWLKVAGTWQLADAEDDDTWACARRTQELALRRGASEWRVLPEGHTPDEDDAQASQGVEPEKKRG